MEGDEWGSLGLLFYACSCLVSVSELNLDGS